MSQKNRIGVSVSASRYFGLTNNHKFGLRPELMMEATRHRAKVNLFDIDGISAGFASAAINEYTLTPAILAEAQLHPIFYMGLGLSFPITIAHYTRILPASSANFDTKNEVQALTSYHKLGVNLPIYAGINLGKRMRLGLRVDKGLTNRKKTSIADFRQYDTNIRILLGFKF